MCPPGLLELYPSELVVEYGQSLDVYCTSLSTGEFDTGGVEWQIPLEFNISDSTMSDVPGNYTRWTVQSLQEWDIEAHCIFTDGTGFQCNESLSLTVYKAPENVSITLVNHTEVMADGRSYELQCDVLDVAPVKNLKVRWYKENVPVNESRFVDTERGPRNVSASLRIFPTREDDGVAYRCEAELDLGPQRPLTRSSDPLSITVKKDLSLWGDAGTIATPTMPTSAIATTPTAPAATGPTEVPTSTPQLDIDVVAVSPGPMAVGENYTLSCHIEISTPVTPYLYGNVTVNVKALIGQDLVGTQIMQDIEDTYMNITSDFLYTPLKTHDGEKYQCVVEIQPPGNESNLERKSEILNIQVYSGCPVDISPSTLVVRYGGPASSTCRALVPIDGMGWESPVGAVPLEDEVTELNWTVKELREWTLTPQCYINSKKGTQCVRDLSVVAYETPESLSITTEKHIPMAAGKENTLICHIENIAPVLNLTVKWFKRTVDGSTVELSEDESHQSSISTGPQNLTSSYTFFPNISDNETQYWCEADLNLGPGGPPKLTSDPLTITVYSGCPIVISPPSLVVKYGDSASANCSTFIPHNGIGWNSTLGPVSKVQGVQQVSWSTKNLTKWTVKPTCVIDTDDGQCSRDLNVSVYSFPDAITVTATTTGAMAEGKNYSLFCHLENVAPVQHLTLKWFKGDTRLPTDDSHQSNNVGKQNVTNKILIVPNMSDNGAQYWCEADLNLGPGGPPKLTSDPLTITVYSGCPIVISPPSLVVKYGDSASANCSTFIPHNGIGWNSTLGPVSKVQGVQQVSWSVEKLTEWSVKPKCLIDTDDELCYQDLSVTVYSFPDAITVTATTTGAMAEGKNYSLFCHLENVAPVQHLTLKWFKGDTRLPTDDSHQSNNVGKQNVTSEILIVPNISDNGTQYWCEADLNLGPGGPPKLTSDPLTITVYSGCPIVISPPSLVVKYGDSASADCRALIPHNGIGWNSTLGPVSKVQGVQPVSWSVEKLTEWSVKPKCLIDTDDGLCYKDLSVTVYQMPSKITLTSNHTGKMTAGQFYFFTCHIQDVAPVQNLKVNWLKGENYVLPEQSKDQGIGEGPHNLTFDLRIQPTASDDGEKYRCEARLDLGPVSPPVVKSDQYVITIPADWTTTIIIIFLIILLIILILIIAIRYYKSKQGNYSIVQTNIPMADIPKGGA
ncbi:intercellular adhesion molecule 5 isoform X2 [Sardina pilchardus]